MIWIAAMSMIWLFFIAVELGSIHSELKKLREATEKPYTQTIWRDKEVKVPVVITESKGFPYK